MSFSPLARRLPPWFASWLAMILVGCGGPPSGENRSDLPDKQAADGARNCGPGTIASAENSKNFFSDISDTVGLDFQRTVGPLGTYFLPEINGSGGAMFDYDADGDLDIFLVNSGRSPKGFGPLPQGTRLENRLYRQEADGTLYDATTEAGLADTSYGISCAVGDVDNDGDLDLFVANYGQDLLYLNNADGTFQDGTAAVGLATRGWTTAAAFCDYDRDGWLDLAIVQYGTEVFDGHKRACDYGNKNVGYCSPLEYDPAPDILLHNEGPGPDGRIRFRDVTATAGLSQTIGTGFCVVCADFNGDHWPDLYVANDMYPNRIWMNNRDGTFTDAGLASGAAVNYLGVGEASMGVALGDVDSDGDWDLLATHFTDETNTLYLNDGGDFRDVTEQWQLGLASRQHTGWGVSFVDLDHDGHVDLPLANGLALPCHWRTTDQDRQGDIIDVDKLATQTRGPAIDPSTYWSEYADRNQVFFNSGQGQFIDRTAQGGDFCRQTGSARALIHGDIDNDGDIDLLVTTCGTRARLYRNDVPKIGHWLRVRAVDPGLKRDAYGAEVTVIADRARHHRILNPAGSFLASNDIRIHVGLAPARYDRIEVRWPSGDTAIEVFEGGASDREIVLTRGQGTPGSR